MITAPQKLAPGYYVNFLRGLVLLMFLCFAIPCLAQEISIGEYRNNLHKAITALDTLGKKEANETAENYRHRLTETVAAVRNLVPAKQSITQPGSVCKVDNSWFHKRLNELETVSDGELESNRKQLIEGLRALEQRVDEFENARSKDSLSKEEAKRKLGEILSRSDYAPQGKQGSALLRLIDRFFRWLASFLPQPKPMSASKGSPLTLVAQILVVVLALAVLTFALLKVLRHFRGSFRKTTGKKRLEPRVVLGEKLEPDASATDLLAEAETLARGGEIRAAIRKAYIALLVELGDRKVISLAQHKTNRDYLRAVIGSPALYNNMSGLTNSFERHWYGFAESTNADWQDFKSAYLAALRAGQ